MGKGATIYRISLHDLYLSFCVILITLASSRALTGNDAILEYLGYGLIFLAIIRSYFQLSLQYRRKYITWIALLLAVLLSTGIILAQLSVTRKIITMATMLAAVMMAIVSENLIHEPKTIRNLAYACLWGVILSMVLCILSGVPFVERNVEGTFGIYWSFTGGIQFKNIATIMLAIIISLYIYRKETGIRHFSDSVISAVALLLIILAHSRGAWIHTVVFFTAVHYKDVKKIKKRQRALWVVVLACVAIAVAVLFFQKVAKQSSTYMFRYRGLMNYLDMFKNDTYHLWFGNAGIAYDKELNYVMTIRSITGFDGSLEIAWLNILIKNGLLGMLGFIIIFVRALVTTFRCDDYEIKTIYIAVIVTLLGTSFVADYIQSVHGIFGMYSYLLMAYLSGKIHRKELKANKTINQYANPYMIKTIGGKQYECS